MCVLALPEQRYERGHIRHQASFDTQKCVVHPDLQIIIMGFFQSHKINIAFYSKALFSTLAAYYVDFRGNKIQTQNVENTSGHPCFRFVYVIVLEGIMHFLPQ